MIGWDVLEMLRIGSAIATSTDNENPFSGRETALANALGGAP